MADRVIRLRSHQSQAEAIVALEDTLELLKNGELQGITIVHLNNADEVWMTSLWEKWLTGLGALAAVYAEHERIQV